MKKSFGERLVNSEGGDKAKQAIAIEAVEYYSGKMGEVMNPINHDDIPFIFEP